MPGRPAPTAFVRAACARTTSRPSSPSSGTRPACPPPSRPTRRESPAWGGTASPLPRAGGARRRCDHLKRERRRRLGDPRPACRCPRQHIVGGVVVERPADPGGTCPAAAALGRRLHDDDIGLTARPEAVTGPHSEPPPGRCGGVTQNGELPGVVGTGILAYVTAAAATADDKRAGAGAERAYGERRHRVIFPAPGPDPCGRGAYATAVVRSTVDSGFPERGGCGVRSGSWALRFAITAQTISRRLRASPRPSQGRGKGGRRGAGGLAAGGGRPAARSRTRLTTVAEPRRETQEAFPPVRTGTAARRAAVITPYRFGGDWEADPLPTGQ